MAIYSCLLIHNCDLHVHCCLFVSFSAQNLYLFLSTLVFLGSSFVRLFDYLVLREVDLSLVFMEGKRQSSSSSSSFTADLFGTKESPPSSSSGIFASILSPPSMGVGRNASNSEVMGSWQKQHPGNKDRISSKQGTAASCTGGASCNIPNKNKSGIVQEEIAVPCHLSSSLYYGGQDIYSHSPSSRAAGSYPVFKKDGEEDDPNGNSHGASRGNWWQGSLYY